MHSLGIMINGSFVFGLDSDDKDVFKRTVNWAVKNALTTCTFHILTPYPGTGLYKRMQSEARMLHSNWDLYDTRNVVYKTYWIKRSGIKRRLRLGIPVFLFVEEYCKGKFGT